MIAFQGFLSSELCFQSGAFWQSREPKHYYAVTAPMLKKSPDSIVIIWHILVLYPGI